MIVAVGTTEVDGRPATLLRFGGWTFRKMLVSPARRGRPARYYFDTLAGYGLESGAVHVSTVRGVLFNAVFEVWGSDGRRWVKLRKELFGCADQWDALERVVRSAS